MITLFLTPQVWGRQERCLGRFIVWGDPGDLIVDLFPL